MFEHERGHYHYRGRKPNEVKYKFVSNAVKGIGKTVMGTGSSTESVSPSKKILPESSQEAAMRNSIYNSYFGSGKQYATAQNRNNQLYSNMNSALSGYTGLQNGEIPQAYQTNFENSIRGGVQRTIGDTLNDLGNRGVINSSVLVDSNNDLESRVADASASNFQSNIGLLSQLLGQKVSGMQQLYNNNQNTIDNATNLYTGTRNARYGLQGDTIVKPAQPGLLQYWAQSGFAGV